MYKNKIKNNNNDNLKQLRMNVILLLVPNDHGYIGKNNIMKGMELFHKKYENVVLMINVTRYPYSFMGDSKKDDMMEVV